ncbi:MAG: hypothetical protein ACLU5C_06260 [Acutalibacter sp.]
MPCFGTTSRTMSNAQRIAQELGSASGVSIERPCASTPDIGGRRLL